jgi:hypothetical protein
MSWIRPEISTGRGYAKNYMLRWRFARASARVGEDALSFPAREANVRC